MFNNKYSNFIRSGCLDDGHTCEITNVLQRKSLSGEEAKTIYLEEVKEARRTSESIVHVSTILRDNNQPKRFASQSYEINISDKDLFLAVQNDDVNTIKQVLHHYPDKINKVDEFGWSLLMIACQANSVATAKELLKKGVNTDIRDKAGNSAQSLIIKNKNYQLAGILLSCKEKKTENDVKNKCDCRIEKRDEYFCESCKVTCPDKDHHLSSTIHNINLSKGKKIPTNYVIPESNIGYQLMLRVGWDKESGLGPDGAGKKYPIKSIQKKDRKGLGHGKIRRTNLNQICNDEHLKNKLVKNNKSSTKFEINFRRQFY